MGKQWKQWETVIFLGSKITADGDCSREIKSCLFLGRKVMINLGSILKGRDITLPTKINLVKAIVFPVVMYGCKSWTIKKAHFSSAQSLSRVRLFATPWITARQASLSPPPGVHTNSCPSNQWCHPAISSSVVLFSSCPQSLPASSLFQWVNSSHEVAKVLQFQR